ncbi:hypothetical protein SI65_08618 [Aspergillus cristatus]|uniref:F-box domain-containing protein n=1 Tax=Aspergillus cristatus TaxID=573508 RepID=A0A1E3B4G9_ASPCR|nr:hypothetical protein SI65_08618 [Aspergillus cristatus]
MNLLDLPAEILENIAKEVRPTNSLAPLALVCSDLHALVVPILYSQFEFAWPQYFMDYSRTAQALHHGLRTLVMDKGLFQPDTACSSCQQSTLQEPAATTTKTTTRRAKYEEETITHSIHASSCWNATGQDTMRTWGTMWYIDRFGSR